MHGIDGNLSLDPRGKYDTYSEALTGAKELVLIMHRAGKAYCVADCQSLCFSTVLGLNEMLNHRQNVRCCGGPNDKPCLPL